MKKKIYKENIWSKWYSQLVYSDYKYAYYRDQWQLRLNIYDMQYEKTTHLHVDRTITHHNDDYEIKTMHIL